VQAQLLYLVASDPKIHGAYVFTRNPADPKTMLWIVTSNLHPKCKCNVTRNTPYDPATHATEMFAAFQHPTTSPGIYSDVYGSWLSGYAPIRDAKGTAVAIAEVDVTAQSVVNVQNHIKDASIRVFIIVLACLLAVIPLMAAVITNPLKIVTLAARALEVGSAPDRFALERATQGRDEVSQLARVFIRMTDEVRAREEKLMRQVQDLKIEIDLAKQETQVAEITETDFFRELQQKAQRMRARATEPVPALPGV
jgi:nitrate/nitrite-specific signal transduction histidine kinase